MDGNISEDTWKCIWFLRLKSDHKWMETKELNETIENEEVYFKIRPLID